MTSSSLSSISLSSSSFVCLTWSIPLFYKKIYYWPGLLSQVVGIITKGSVRNALAHGITSNEVYYSSCVSTQWMLSIFRSLPTWSNMLIRIWGNTVLLFQAMCQVSLFPKIFRLTASILARSNQTVGGWTRSSWVWRGSFNRQLQGLWWVDKDIWLLPIRWMHLVGKCRWSATYHHACWLWTAQEVAHWTECSASHCFLSAGLAWSVSSAVQFVTSLCVKPAFDY